MKNVIKLIKYGQIISEKDIGDRIYHEIHEDLEKHDKAFIDFSGLISMATFCAKQIFGRLYIDLSPNVFFEKVSLENVSDDLKIIIRVGIQNALEEVAFEHN